VAEAKQTNDDIKFALRIHKKLPFSVVGIDTTNATREPGEPTSACQYGDDLSQTVWFRVKIQRAGYYEFNTAGSTYDTVLTLYQAPAKEKGFDGLRQLMCWDDNWPTRPLSLQAMLQVDLEPGTYYAQVGDYGAPNLEQPHTTNFLVKLATD
jgi:hypothetical protein